ncbi:hypothetical protein JCM10213_004158 [Rhodosporidiobolus nylandii]
MIWKTHKEVCGDRSNPFLWPDLSAKEAQFAKDVKDLKPSGDDGPQETLGEFMAHQGIPPSLFNSIINALTKGNKPRLPLATQQALLLHIRARAGIIASAPAMAIGTNQDVVLANDVFTQTGNTVKLISSTCAEHNAPPGYMSLLCHKVLYYFALNQLG